MLDDRDAYTPGWKFADWEMRGVPVRLEIGPKDIEKAQVVLARRDTREKQFVPMAELVPHVQGWLTAIQASLFERAMQVREERTHYTESYEEFKTLMAGARPGFVHAPWCDDAAVEAQVKAETQATIRNYPFGASVCGRQGLLCHRAPCDGDGLFRQGLLGYPHSAANASGSRAASFFIAAWRLVIFSRATTARKIVTNCPRNHGSVGALPGVCDHVEHRRITHLLQRRQHADRRLIAQRFERLSEVVDRQPAATGSERQVDRGAKDTPDLDIFAPLRRLVARTRSMSRRKTVSGVVAACVASQ